MPTGSPRVYICFGTPEPHLSQLETAARKGGRFDWWNIKKSASPEDRVIFYMIRPRSAFVATGVVDSEVQPCPDQTSTWRDQPCVWVRDISMLPRHVPLSEAQRHFPEWRFLRQPHRSTDVPSALAMDFLSFLQANDPATIRFAEESDIEEMLDEGEEARINEAEIPETEKEQLIKARRGQGIFRVRVEEIETTCRMTGVNDKRFLIASHIKPWRTSNNAEKLDGSNGLLLSPHVDKLFDKGWLSFSDDGKVLWANDDIRRLMIQWGLNPDKNVGAFNLEQRKYLPYHRENIYKA